MFCQTKYDLCASSDLNTCSESNSPQISTRKVTSGYGIRFAPTLRREALKPITDLIKNIENNQIQVMYITTSDFFTKSHLFKIAGKKNVHILNLLDLYFEDVSSIDDFKFLLRERYPIFDTIESPVLKVRTRKIDEMDIYFSDSSFDNFRLHFLG